MNKATIRLFKAVPVEGNKTVEETDYEQLVRETIRYGFVFAPEVVANYSDCRALIKIVRESIGMTAEELNNSFHKSWVKIKEANLEDLVVEQLAHYLTTYGKEEPGAYLIEKEMQWGVQNLADKVVGLEDFEPTKVGSDYIYIPKEKLEIPELQDDIKLVVIRGYTKEELKAKLLKLLSTGIALAEDTIKDVLDVAGFVGVQEEDISSIKNKEVKAALYDYLDLFPENPVEFLRYIIFVATNDTLIIKNEELISKIKEKDNLGTLKLFREYEEKYGLHRLAEIFYRYKPIFLAFRVNSGMKTITNKIRRLAIKHHRPMPEDYLNTITSKIKNDITIDSDMLRAELKKVNTFRKIRLVYALKFRTKDVTSILYRIRNGKSWATEIEKYNMGQRKQAKQALDVILDSIAKDVSKNVEGKKIYIPDYINYTLPATEKGFTGNFPSGTCISVPKDMIFGIHWNNVKDHRIDLDLSLIDSEGEKMGWDGFYRGTNILFSGDMTNARDGATELFYVQRGVPNPMIVFVNYYNFNAEIEVPFKILVAKEHAENFDHNYMVDPNNVVAIANSKINKRQQILGLVATTGNESKFYFAETNIGQSITSSYSEWAEHSRKYLVGFYENAISLKDVLRRAGAKLVEEKGKAEIDLSPENIDKTTILGLLK